LGIIKTDDTVVPTEMRTVAAGPVFDDEQLRVSAQRLADGSLAAHLQVSQSGCSVASDPTQRESDQHTTRDGDQDPEPHNNRQQRPRGMGVCL